MTKEEALKIIKLLSALESWAEDHQATVRAGVVGVQYQEPAA